MNLAVIVPFTRPAFIIETLANLARQREAFKLVVVENNGGLGQWASRHLPCDALACSSHAGGKSHALNVGMEVARDIGCDYFAVFDDDDFYGAGYLTEVIRCADKADATGLQRFALTIGASAPKCFSDTVADAAVTEGLHGATLAGATRGLPEFIPIAFSEEVLWCRDIVSAGKTLYSRRGDDYVYRRYLEGHGHTFPMHPQEEELIPWHAMVRSGRSD